MKAKSNIYYLVYYYGGDYDSEYNVNLFVTDKKAIAKRYCSKFNKILKKWKLYYKQFETLKRGWRNWIAKEHVEKHFDRWDKLRNIDKCTFCEIMYKENEKKNC